MRGASRVIVWVAVLALSAPAVMTAQGADQRTSSDDVFRAIARQQTRAVVAITTTKWLEPAAAEDAEWYQRFFGRPIPRGPQRQREAASGLLISADGDILTNDHVVADADIIDVRLPGSDTMTYRAAVVGRDPVTDSAVIRLIGAPSHLPVAVLGDSDTIEAGDWIMAIGNPFQLGSSVTMGVVSHPARSLEVSEGHWQKLIQTDASINPGSSGGPLLNARGEVVGLTLAVLADGIGDSMGIGFAVPINIIKTILPALRTGRVVRGSLGVRLRHAVITGDDAVALGLPHARGALILEVEKGSSAAAAGFRAGDVFVEFVGVPVATADDLLTRIWSTRPGSRARAVVIRDGYIRALDVTVDELPSPVAAPRQRRTDPVRDLGLTLGDVVPSAHGPVDGARIERVEDDGIGAIAGLAPGDVIRKVNHHSIRTAADALRELHEAAAGRTVFLLIWRDGDEQIVEIVTE